MVSHAEHEMRAYQESIWWLRTLLEPGNLGAGPDSHLTD